MSTQSSLFRRLAAIVAVSIALLAACGSATKDPYADSLLSTTLPSSTVPGALPDPLDPHESGTGVKTPGVSAPSGGSAPSLAETPRRVVQVVYQKGMRSGWKDVGWDPTRKTKNGPARIDLGNGGGWLIAGQPPSNATGLEFRFRMLRDLGPVIRIIVGSADAENIGRELRLNRVKADSEGWVKVRIPLSQMNPKGVAFSQVRFAPVRRLRSPATVEIDDFVFTAGGSMTRYGSSAGEQSPAPTTVARRAQSDVAAVSSLKSGLRIPETQNIAVDCKADEKPISQLIYGIGWVGAGDQPEPPWDLYAGANRWGGNPTSRFNWKHGNAWNTANDYFFRNVRVADAGENAMDVFLQSNEEHSVPSAVSVPTLGWVAKDVESYSFPTSEFGPQARTDPDIADAGNGVGKKNSKPIFPGNPQRTSVASSPASITSWVQSQLRGRVTMYFLDNEPDLWNSTHRDVRPQPLGYDELLQNTIDYATAIRKADPDAIIAGPSSWGWPGYFYSAADAAAGFNKAPDRNAHGGMALLPWYLKAMRTYEIRNDVRLLNVLDVHFYPAATGLYTPGAENDDPAIAAKRLRSTRGLWDPSYVDESWVGEAIYLIPRLRQWIDQYAPGIGISIGEWNFGGETHMSGGLAVAEALGRFGGEGVTSAFYWTAPPKGSPAFWGFRAFRNYDGKGANFNRLSIRAQGRSGSTISSFASRDDSGHEVTMVLLNNSPSNPEVAKATFLNCLRLESYKTYTYTGDANGFRADDELGAVNDSVTLRLPPYSITVLRARLR